MDDRPAIQTKASPENSATIKERIPMKVELGRATWNFLHTIAKYMPENMSSSSEFKFKLLLEVLSEIYPCYECQTHFKELLNKFKFRSRSRRDVVFYVCKLHNEVNKLLQKKVYDCSALINKS
jgi:hypothetical protein